MLNYISNLFHCISIFIFSLIFVIINKFYFQFSEQYNSNVINQNPLISSLLIKIFGSNHPRRTNISITIIKNIKRKFTLKINQLFSKNYYDNNFEPTSFWKVNLLDKKIKLKEILFVGDSHVEYYSRIYKVNSRNKNLLIKSLWIGPTTLAGFSTSMVVQKWLKTVLKSLQISKYSCKNKAIVFSLGHIDIRTSIGFLIITKAVSNPEEAIEKLSNIFENLLQSNFMQDLLSSYSRVAWMAIPPSSPEEGMKIENCSKKQAMNLKRNDNFTIFGSSSERAIWTSLLNKKLNLIADKYYFDFLYDSSLSKSEDKNYEPKVMKLSDSFDGVHLSSHNIILKIIKNCISMDSHDF